MTSLIQKYLDRRWGIIPIRPKGHVNEKTGEIDEKAPFVKWAEFKSSSGSKPSEDQILDWLAHFDHADWAALTGYDNLVLVDIDDPNLYDLYLDRFKKCIMRTPSGGISFLIRSTVVPKSITRINGVAVDIKATDGYAILPSKDLSDEEIKKEEQEEKEGTRKEFIRHWINFDEPEETDDILEELKSLLPKIKPDIKPAKGVPTAIQWARDHNIQISYDGGRYLQTVCPFHNDTKPSMSIYADGFYCHSCHKSGGLFALIKSYSNKSDDEILAEFPGIKKQKKTITDNVIEIVENNVHLVRDHNNNSYFKLDDYSDIGISLLPINSKITRYWISTIAEKTIDKLPPEHVLSYVIKQFDGKCLAKGERIKIFRRMGGDQNTIWYDLGNNNFVKITKDALGVYPDTDITFMRETNQGVQTVPIKREIQNIFKLFDIVNVKDPAQQTLLLTWVVNSLLPWAQSPILLLCGARGSGKSYMARIIKRTLDPVEGNSSELLVNKPKDINYLIGLLSHNAVAVLDNISTIDRETSDVLCNVVTGGVIATRELYTTNDQVLIDIRSKLIVTAINSQIFESGSGDLAERTVGIEISRPEDNYMSEEYLNEKFEACRGEIFGAILSLAQGYIKDGLPKEGEVSEFRLTTFASVGKYLTKVLNLKPSFEVAYRQNQSGMCQNSLEAEPVTEFFVNFAKKYGESDFNNSSGWGISADYLFSKFYNQWIIESNNLGADKKLPNSSSKLLTRLKRIEPDLKKIYGIKVESKGIHRGKKWIKFVCSNKNLIDDEEEEENKEASNEANQSSITDKGW
jgi:energy-coupling factor transporter ATP-binding protein EcfA2